MLIPPRRQPGQMLGRTLDPLDAQDGGAMPSAFGYVPLALDTRILAGTPAKSRQGAGALPKTGTPDAPRFSPRPAGPRTGLPPGVEVGGAPNLGDVLKGGVVLAPVAAPGSSDVTTTADAPDASGVSSTLFLAFAIVAVAWVASR